MTANITNKPTSPRQYCRRCGKTFKGHPTKKYCTDTCRQYAYLDRQAMTVGEPLQNDNIDTEGINDPHDSQAVNDVKNNRDNKDIDNSPTPFAMQEPDLQNEKGTMDNTTKPESPSINKAVNDSKNQQVSMRQKQPVIDTSGLTAGNNPPIATGAENIAGLHKKSDNLKELTLPENDPITVNDHQQQKASITPPPAKQEPQYRYIQSGFIQEIETRVSEKNYAGWFRNPYEHWDGIAYFYIRWANERLKCLLDNLILLTYKNEVNADTIQALSEAFSQLTASDCYKQLPESYPYIAVIDSYHQKIAAIARDMQDSQGQKFLLMMGTRAEILCILWEIGKSVERKKFSELTFT